MYSHCDDEEHIPKSIPYLSPTPQVGDVGEPSPALDVTTRMSAVSSNTEHPIYSHPLLSITNILSLVVSSKRTSHRLTVASKLLFVA